jgi:hypothetical protein
MITLPEHVKFSTAEGEANRWNGVDAANGTPNKETEMDWAEHQRIVCAARQLVQGDPPGGGEVKKAFKELKSAYNDEKGRSEIRVSKGIHQPTVDPHLQIRMTTKYSPNNISTRKFHLNVSAETNASTNQLGDENFLWQPVQFSFKHSDGLIYTWPVAAVAGKKKGDAGRRLSISNADLKDSIAELRERERQAAFNNVLNAFMAEQIPPITVIKHTNENKNGIFPSVKFSRGQAQATVFLQGKIKNLKYFVDDEKIKIV